MARKSLKSYRQESEENMRLLVDQAIDSRAAQIDFATLATQAYSPMSEEDLQDYSHQDLFQRNYEFGLKHAWKRMFPDGERAKRQPHLDGEVWVADIPRKMLTKNAHGLHCLVDQLEATVDQSEEGLKIYTQPLNGPLRVVRGWAAANGFLRTLELRHGYGKAIGELLRMERLEAASQTTGIA